MMTSAAVPSPLPLQQQAHGPCRITVRLLPPYSNVPGTPGVGVPTRPLWNVNRTPLFFAPGF